MKKGKVIYTGKSGHGNEFIIRYPQKKDAKLMWEYINTISKERTFISFQGEEISIEDETEFLNSQLEKISKNKAVLLLVFSNDEVIGISGINMSQRIEKHIGIFGISLAKDFRAQGIGTKLMELVFEEAENNLHGLEIVTLGVFDNNPIAKEMYERFGFLEYGNLPKGIILENGYQDHIFMYKTIK